MVTARLVGASLLLLPLLGAAGGDSVATDNFTAPQSLPDTKKMAEGKPQPAPFPETPPEDWKLSHPPQSRLPALSRWLCYYGKERKVFDVPGVDLLILDAEAVGAAPKTRPGKQLRLAYLGLGEVDESRWYWSETRDKVGTLGENPHWPKAWYVDPRSDEWKGLLLDRVTRRFLDLGYDGFMLDTLDTAETLLRRDPQKFAGAPQAMVGLVKALRERYPKVPIVANGGLSLFPALAQYVDGLVYEGARFTYDPGTHKYRPRTSDETAWLDPRLKAAQRLGLPVLALEYAEPGDPARTSEVEAEVRRAGYVPFVSVILLDRVPEEAKP